MSSKITISVTVNESNYSHMQAMSIELEAADWLTGGNPAFLAKDFAAKVAELSEKIQAHLAQEYGDIRESTAKPA